MVLEAEPVIDVPPGVKYAVEAVMPLAAVHVVAVPPLSVAASVAPVAASYSRVKASPPIRQWSAYRAKKLSMDLPSGSIR